VTPWYALPGAHCDADEIFETPVLLICASDRTVILGTLATLLSLVIVGRHYREAWNPPTKSEYDESGDFKGDPNYYSLRSSFDAACGKGGHLYFLPGAQVPDAKHLDLGNWSRVERRHYEEGTQKRFPYPSPIECARIWRRLRQLAPAAANPGGQQSDRIQAITLESLLTQEGVLEARRVNLGSRNTWTRLLLPRVPAVLIPSNSLYLGRWRPWDPFPAPKDCDLLYLLPTGLAALQSGVQGGVRTSPDRNAALIGDCWLSVARHMSRWENLPGGGAVAQTSKAVWSVKMVDDENKRMSRDWPRWRPTPLEYPHKLFADLPWLVE
jgi:hypothetical protein